MFELSMGLGVGLFLFFCTITAYVTGVGHGRLMINNQVPKLNLNPVKAISKAVEQHKEEKKVEALTDELTVAMGYSKESALEAVKKER
jgi:hypothetical protein